MDSQLDVVSLSNNKLNWQDRKSSLTRSQTDSNITYAGDEVLEAAGSTCYITKDGDIDFQVVLKAVHRTSLRESGVCTLRVLEVILNLVELLLDMGVLKQCLRDEAAATAAAATAAAQDANTSPQMHKSSSQKAPTNDNNTSSVNSCDLKPMTSHTLIMSTIIRL